MGVSDWFETFNKRIRISDEDLSKIRFRYKNITKRINLDYYDSDSAYKHSYYVGSYGRGTEIYTSDIDMLIELPSSIYFKFNKYSGNKQSALLQEVKNILKKTYSTSDIKADGQIISIPFTDNVNFEILPAFINTSGYFTYPNSNNGGSWKSTDPLAEIKAINELNNSCNKNLKRLCRMARSWKEKNNVPISGMLIDILAYNFIKNWVYRDKSYLYYDFMTRDFFEYLSKQDMEKKYWLAMGSGRYIYRSGIFENKAKNAYETSIRAINYEQSNSILAKYYWGDIYGSKFPL